jgi:hypothetical protein
MSDQQKYQPSQKPLVPPAMPAKASPGTVDRPGGKNMQAAEQTKSDGKDKDSEGK